MNEVKTKAILAKQASLEMALVSAEVKNAFLQSLATLLRENSEFILDENEIDIQNNQERLNPALIDRLRLNENRIEAMAKGCEDIIALNDPNGSVIEEFTRPNGLDIQKIRENTDEIVRGLARRGFAFNQELFLSLETTRKELQVKTRFQCFGSFRFQVRIFSCGIVQISRRTKSSCNSIGIL